jgi:hypothetical protein
MLQVLKTINGVFTSHTVFFVLFFVTKNIF